MLEETILSLVESLEKNSFLNSPIEVPNDENAPYVQKINEYRQKLIHTMCQSERVMDYLESKGVISRSFHSRICHEYRVPEDRNRVLIDFLCTRAKHAYLPLIEALYLAGNNHLIELLDRSFFLSNIPQQLDSTYRFPSALAQQTNVPTSFEDAKLRSMPINLEDEDDRSSLVDSIDIETIKYNDELPMGFSIQMLTSELLELYPQFDPQRRSIDCYRMLSKPRGYCLLINNVDAFRTMPCRQGSDIDASKLKSLFTQLGFVVILRRNLIHTDMMSTIKKFAMRIEETKDRNDCTIMIILSHGSNGMIYSVDEIPVDVKREIITQFDDCLIGKPKLFIFQACQDSQENIRPSSIESPCSSNNDTITRVPMRQDMAIWYSTIKDHVSWRAPETGSVFIQTLITVFARSAWFHDFLNMIELVNRTIEEKFAVHELTPHQSSYLEHHLRYPLYFNPGHYEKTDGNDDDEDDFYYY